MPINCHSSLARMDPGASLSQVLSHARARLRPLILSALSVHSFDRWPFRFNPFRFNPILSFARWPLPKTDLSPAFVRYYSNNPVNLISEFFISIVCGSYTYTNFSIMFKLPVKSTGEWSRIRVDLKTVDYLRGINYYASLYFTTFIWLHRTKLMWVFIYFQPICRYDIRCLRFYPWKSSVYEKYHSLGKIKRMWLKVLSCCGKPDPYWVTILSGYIVD